MDKPAGVSSHAVVARVRAALGIRKVGHAGTLDPAATGVLVIGVGRATRLLGYLTKADKTYESTIRLGVATHTDDADGEVTSTAGCEHLDDAAIHEAFGTQRGVIEQIPSAVSAVKIDGRRSYDRVRAGEQVSIPARRVVIEELQVEDIRRGGVLPDGAVDVDIRVRCSAGTYIRAIARDVGGILGVGGHVRVLRRVASGAFDIDTAHPLQEVVEAGDGAREWLMSLRDAAGRALPMVVVDAQAAGEIAHGRVITWPGEADADGPHALVDDAQLLAIAERAGNRTRYLAVFA